METLLALILENIIGQEWGVSNENKPKMTYSCDAFTRDYWVTIFLNAKILEGHLTL